MYRPNGFTIPCKIASENSSEDFENRETALLKKLKADLYREEAQLILLKKLRASQQYNSASNKTNETRQSTKSCRGKLANPKQTNHVKVSRLKDASSYHPSFMLSPLDTGFDRQWTGNKSSQNRQVTSFNQTPPTNYTAHHNDQALKRQNLRKSVDKFLFSVRSYRNRLSSSFLPTAPINFLPSPISHDFTMLLGLEEICRFVQKRISQEPPIGINQCALCGNYCSPLFFRLNDIIHCTMCLRSMRFRQLENEQIDRLRQTLSEKPDMPYCPLNSEQLRLCQAQWMRQARLLSSPNSGYSGSPHFLSPAVAAAAAIAAMTATHSGHFQEEQPVALNLAVKEATQGIVGEELLSPHFHK